MIRLWSALLLLSIALTSVAHAEPDCATAIKRTLEQLTQLRPEFKHSERYTKKLQVTDVRDQCHWGSCWIHADLAEHEAMLLKKYGKQIDLSEQWVILQSLKVRASDALQVPGQEVIDGGNMVSAEWLIQEFGVVPSNVWSPKIAFDSNSAASSRLNYFINNRIGEFHLKAADLSPAERASELQKAQQEIFDTIDTYAEIPPDPQKLQFVFNGKTTNALEFAKEVLPQNGTQIVYVKPEEPALPAAIRELVKQKRPLQLPSVSTIPGVKTIMRMPYAEIEKRIADSIIKNGRPVVISYENQKIFFDRKRGIYSISAWENPSGFTPLPRAYRSTVGQSAGSHAVVVAGVHLDRKGKVVKFWNKNSWGVESGDNGFNHMYSDFAEHFLNGAYLRVKKD